MADLYELADKFRSQAAGRERKAATEMVQAYGQAWTKIRTELDTLTKEIEAERKAGRPVSVGWLFENERLANLLRETEAQVGEFARFAESTIVNEQARAVEAAQKNTGALVEHQLDGNRPPGVLASFQRLPKEALDDLVGFLSDGTPLRALLDELGPSASAHVRKALIQGVATGANPRKIARAVRKELGGDLVRALRISRTEVLRSYRESSIRAMRENDVVERWRWNATKTTRTCAMCLAMDGQEFPVTTPFGSHPNCRCGPIPVTKYFTPKETGAEWFAKLPETDQREVLKKGKFELYAAGKLQLTDLVAERRDPKWGLVRSERSLKAVKKANERKGNATALAAGAAGRSERSGLDARLQNLPEVHRKPWESTEARRKALFDVLDAHGSGDGAALRQGVEHLSGALEAGLGAAGFPSAPGRVWRLEESHRPLQAQPPRTVTLDVRVLRQRITKGGGPDEVWRALLQEAVHTRQDISEDYLQELIHHVGYEEGLAEGVALWVCREPAGMTVSGNATYQRFVRSYKGLAETLGVEENRLYQELWSAPAGRVRDQLPRAVAALKNQALTAEQQAQIQQVGDELFASEPPDKSWTAEELRAKWAEIIP